MKKKIVYLPVDKNNDLEIEINKVYERTGSLSAVSIAEKAYSLGIGQFKKKDLYTFTEEELNQYTESVIKKALDIASDYAKTIDVGYYNGEEWKPYDIVDKQSITNLFEEVYKNFKV